MKEKNNDLEEKLDERIGKTIKSLSLVLRVFSVIGMVCYAVYWMVYLVVTGESNLLGVLVSSVVFLSSYPLYGFGLLVERVYAMGAPSQGKKAQEGKLVEVNAENIVAKTEASPVFEEDEDTFEEDGDTFEENPNRCELCGKIVKRLTLCKIRGNESERDMVCEICDECMAKHNATPKK